MTSSFIERKGYREALPGILSEDEAGARRGECVLCGERLSQRIISHCAGAYEEVSVSFTELPCLGCDHPGHPKRFANVEFGERLIDTIFETGEFPAGKQRPLGGIAGRMCGARIKAPPRQGGGFSGEFVFPGLPKFQVAITGPAVRCDDCGREQLYADREAGRKVCEAMSIAFRQVNLNP